MILINLCDLFRFSFIVSVILLLLIIVILKFVDLSGYMRQMLSRYINNLYLVYGYMVFKEIGSE